MRADVDQVATPSTPVYGVNTEISPVLVDLMATKMNEDPLPQIDTTWSVGASDLVPLARLPEWLLSAAASAETHLPQAKDTLSLVNCNAVSLAHPAWCLSNRRTLCPR